MPETFSDLPDALVRDLLAAAAPLAGEVRARFDQLVAHRSECRDAAQAAGFVKRKVDLDVSRDPSVVGIDGSYQLYRLTSADLCAAAAIAVEGTAKEARRHWQEPYHRFWAGALPHNESTTLALRGLMTMMELDLASQAPHDMVLLDGSFASLVIYLNQGLSNIPKTTGLGAEIERCWLTECGLSKLLQLLGSDRAIAVPKYTSRNEIARISGELASVPCDGRTLATLILEPGEYTRPLPIYWAGIKKEEYHLPSAYCSAKQEVDLNDALGRVGVIYFRPFGWVPALRLEVPGPIASSTTRLSMVLQGITSQFFSPAVVEPYPLFLADRMVKSLGAGVAVMEQTIAQEVTNAGHDIELTTLLLQNYRTEGGRGGV